MAHRLSDTLTDIAAARISHVLQYNAAAWNALTHAYECVRSLLVQVISLVLKVCRVEGAYKFATTHVVPTEADYPYEASVYI